MPTPTIVQSTSAASAGGATTTLTLNGVTSGNCLIVQFLSQSSSVGTPTFVDSNGTVTTARISNGFGSGTSIKAGSGYVANANSGTHTFTLTSPSTARPSFGAVQEWSGIPTTSPFDQSGFGGGTTAQTITSGNSGATTAPIELVIACIGVVTSAGVSNMALTDPPAGFTSIVAQQNTTGAEIMAAEICYLTTSVTGVQTTSWSWTNSNTIASAALIATFFSTAAVIQPPLPLGGLPRVQMHWR